jgi:predicted kinase
MNLKEAVTAAKQEVNDLFARHEERSRWIAQVMAMLHFICGKAASGKTSLARELASRHSAVLFSEDEWLTLLDAEINSLADHQRHSKRLKAVLAPLAVRLLQLGVPIVFDFAGNTPNDRAWVRSIFERTDADHVLHVIVASDKECKGRLRLRNETKPEGLYYGFVSEDRFDEVTRYFVPPSAEEKFCVIYYETDVAKIRQD